MRTMVAADKLDNLIFNDVTGKLAEVFKVIPDKQRLDSTHIKANMRRLGRLCIFTETIHKFLLNLKRGHKGQGYQVQIMETYSKEEKGLNLITHVEVEPAHKSDAHALIPAIESVKKRNLPPQELLADSLYGSDENSQGAKSRDVELISPVMGTQKQKGVCLSDFKVSENGLISVCPLGQHPVKTKRGKNRFTAAFDSQKCQCCPHRSQCPVKKGKKFYYLRYTNKDLRIAQ